MDTKKLRPEALIVTVNSLELAYIIAKGLNDQFFCSKMTVYVRATQLTPNYDVIANSERINHGDLGLTRAYAAGVMYAFERKA